MSSKSGENADQQIRKDKDAALHSQMASVTLTDDSSTGITVWDCFASRCQIKGRRRSSMLCEMSIFWALLSCLASLNLGGVPL